MKSIIKFEKSKWVSPFEITYSFYVDDEYYDEHTDKTICKFFHRIVFALFRRSIVITIPSNIIPKGYKNYDEYDNKYGVVYFDDMLMVYFKKFLKGLYSPFSHDWVRTSYLLKDGSWVHETGHRRLGDPERNYDLWQETYPYTYILNSGEIQERKATVTVVEREWRPRWFKWTGLGKFIRRVIEIEFDDEVGERSGSWKGGTLGCSYDILPNETPLDCLRRMEIERNF